MNSIRKMGQPQLKLIRFESADVIAASALPLLTLDTHEMIIPIGMNTQPLPGSGPLSGYQEPNTQ